MLLQRILAAHKKSVEWFYDTKNRAEAVTMMATVSRIKTDDVEKAYDFLHKGNFFERTGAISRTKMNALVGALQQLGDIPPSFDVERVVLPGVTQMSN